MNRSPIAATMIVGLLLVAVPVLVVRRLADGLLPTQAYDLVLAVAVAGWVCVAKAIIDRDAPLHSLVRNRLSPMWQAHSLVEQSQLGVGLLRRTTAETTRDPRLGSLWSPAQPIEDLMPVSNPHFLAGQITTGLNEAGVRLPEPTLRSQESVDPPGFESEEYLAGRGDTLWSIAESRLGHGSHWETIERVNIGREVSPGVFFRKGDALRIGWSVLAPLVTESESAA